MKNTELDTELVELQRVGDQSFSSYLDPRLVAYELPMKSEEQAVEIAKKHCPEGWLYDVWYNSHWCIAWYHGPVSVYYDYGSFYGHVASVDPRTVTHNCRRAGADPDWCGDGSGRTVLEAASKVIKLFRESVEKRVTIWNIIESEIKSIPGITQ